jgi:hypothetical protein
MLPKPLSILLTASILILGCKSPIPTPTPPTPKTASTAAPITDSCAVLTPAEISSVLGVPIDPGEHTLPTSTIMCHWSQTGVPPGATGAGAQRLVLLLGTLDAFNREKNAKANVKVTPAPGIGDDAFYVLSSFGTSLYVRKGSSTVEFSIHNMHLPQADLWAKEKALGIAAAARL